LKGLQWLLWLPEAWYNIGCIHRLVKPRKGCARIVSTHQDIFGTTRTISTNFLSKLPMAVDRSSSSKVTKSQGEWAILGVFFPTALHGIAFGTYTKTAEKIEMPFGMISALGPKNSALCGVTISDGKRQFWGKTSARQA